MSQIGTPLIDILAAVGASFFLMAMIVPVKQGNERWYAQLLVNCLNERGFAFGSAVVTCHTTQVISSQQNLAQLPCSECQTTTALR